MTSSVATAVGRLADLGTLLVSGPDARSYLQGQLSFDMARLGPARLELATCNSAQGRVQAVVWIVERSEGIVLLLPTSILDATLLRLKKFVLRAKAKLELGTLHAYEGSSSAAAPRSHSEVDGISSIGWPSEPARTLLLASPDRFGALPPRDAEWHRDDIRNGLPRVQPQTHESFVAQMLNIDLLGGISFDKGCYTGQEIIARTHFRGTVKRRMLAFRADCPPPAPGTRIVNDGQHAGDVVDSSPAEAGCELLAVISLAQRDASLQLESGTALERVPLPYAIPEV